VTPLTSDEIVTRAQARQVPIHGLATKEWVRALAKVGLVVVDAADTPNEPPFSGAYPGPVVDDAPTWGANYSDIPLPRAGWRWTVNMQDWYSAEVAPMAGEPYWVLVRRTPQPATPPTPVEAISNLIRSFPQTTATITVEETAQSILDALFDGGYRVVAAEDIQ